MLQFSEVVKSNDDLTYTVFNGKEKYELSLTDISELLSEEELQELNHGSLLKEFSIDQWSKHISGVTRYYKNERNGILGQEKKVAKIFDYDPDTDILTLKTNPTYFSSTQGYNNKTNSWKRLRSYTVKIQFTDFKKYTKQASEKQKRTINIWNLSPSTFRKILKVANIKVDCNCASFNWQGKRYRATKVDSAIYPQSISDPIWRKVHGGSDYLCKHLAGIVPIVLKASDKVLKLVQDKKLPLQPARMTGNNK